MVRVELLNEIRALPLSDQLEMLENIVRSVREKSLALPPSPCKATFVSLAEAAEALRSEYLKDPELTAFTALDGEDFHATR